MERQNIPLDGEKILTRKDLHDFLSQALPLPSYYGHNLDALFDSLTDLNTPVCLFVLNHGALEQNLGHYASIFYTVLSRSAQANPQFQWTYEE